MVLKRKAYDALTQWKAKSNGKTALLIDGARRVGKSFLCEEFAKKEYKSHITIDFGNVPKEITDLFDNESYNLDLFFAKLSAFYSTTLYKRESLIIFDEVQQFPRARQLIKYLVADGRYDYLETGSLISLKKNVKDIIIPSEEEHFELFPLDFEEFLWAMGDNSTVPLIKQCFETLTPLGQTLHRKIMNDFRWGGMDKNPDMYLDETCRRMCSTLRSTFNQLASELIAEGKTEKAQKVLQKCIEVIPYSVAPYEIIMLYVADNFYKCNDEKNGDLVLNTLIKDYGESLIWSKKLGRYNMRTNYQENAYYMQHLLQVAYENDREQLLSDNKHYFQYLLK